MIFNISDGEQSNYITLLKVKSYFFLFNNLQSLTIISIERVIPLNICYSY